MAYPVSGQAVMSYSLEKGGYFVVRVYDLLGRLVRTFAEDHPSGTYGIIAPRDIYYHRMTLPNGKETIRKTEILR